MAPESLNYRKFSPQSDVYSLGVCIWEIMMHGIKPWQGIRNHDVIKKIESGEILPKPTKCPWALYDMMQAMWIIDENFRMTALETTHFLEHLLDEIDSGKSFEELTVPDFHKLRSKLGNGLTSKRQSIVPVLNVDASQLPTSTLWRTVENQRLQCEEDEKWLEQEEQKLLPNGSNHSIDNIE
uniref:Protein kinase domain-containing protein n=1 Tax=Panagrolaimus sp. JU765 TaxID=591449 RepID=A0AC34QA71_9BILA